MMHGHEKSDLRHSSNEAAEQGRATGGGGGGAKGGGQGEREPMPHVPDTEPGQRVTGAEARTEGREAAVKHPRWEPYAGKPHVRFYAGGAQ